MLVGEEPAATEVVTKRPFSGRSGQLLDAILEQLELPRDTVRVTNTIRCKGPEGERPSRAAVAACRPALLQEIRTVKPKVVMPMGNFAVGSVLSRENPKITRLRGREQWVPALDTFVFPTFHPAAILYNGGLWRDLAQDFERLPEVMRLPKGYQRPMPKTKVTLLEDKQDVLDSVAEIRAAAAHHASRSASTRATPLLVAADIETCDLDMYSKPVLTIGWTYKAGAATIFPAQLLFGDNPNSIEYPRLDYREEEPNEAYYAVKSLIEDESISWVWQNGKFDCKYMREALDIAARIDEDSLLQHYTLDERSGTQGLDYLSQHFLNAPEYKDVMNKFHVHGHPKKGVRGPTLDWDVVPLETLAVYQGFDVDYTYRLQLKFAAELNKPDNAHAKRLYRDLLLPVVNALTAIELRGVYCDMTYLDEIDAAYKDKLQVLYNELCRHAATPTATIKFADKMVFPKADEGFNPESWKQVQRILYDEKGFPLQHAKDQQPNEPPKGSTDKFALARLLDLTGDPFVERMTEWRTESKLYKSYIRGIRKIVSPDGRVHPDYNVSGTETGRLSGSLMMTIPRPPKDNSRANIRRLFSADPRRAEPHVLVEADYSQCEMRVATVRSGTLFFEGVFNRDEDLHSATAHKLYGAVITDEQRSRAKTVNFGVLYGMSVRALARRENISLAEAEAFIIEYFMSVPELKDWMSATFEQALKDNYVETATGRRRRFGLITKRSRSEVQRLAINTPIQADANDLNLMATVALEADRRAKELGVLPLLLNHDSILFEVPEASVSEAIPIIRTAMETQAARLYSKIGMEVTIPFRVDFKVGTNWGQLEELIGAS